MFKLMRNINTLNVSERSIQSWWLHPDCDRTIRPRQFAHRLKVILVSVFFSWANSSVTHPDSSVLYVVLTFTPSLPKSWWRHPDI